MNDTPGILRHASPAQLESNDVLDEGATWLESMRSVRTKATAALTNVGRRAVDSSGPLVAFNLLPEVDPGPGLGRIGEYRLQLIEYWRKSQRAEAARNGDAAPAPAASASEPAGEPAVSAQPERSRTRSEVPTVAPAPGQPAVEAATTPAGPGAEAPASRSRTTRASQTRDTTIESINAEIRAYLRDLAPSPIVREAPPIPAKDDLDEDDAPAEDAHVVAVKAADAQNDPVAPAVDTATVEVEENASAEVQETANVDEPDLVNAAVESSPAESASAGLHADNEPVEPAAPPPSAWSSALRAVAAGLPSVIASFKGKPDTQSEPPQLETPDATAPPVEQVASADAAAPEPAPSVALDGMLMEDEAAYVEPAPMAAAEEDLGSTGFTVTTEDPELTGSEDEAAAPAYGLFGEDLPDLAALTRAEITFEDSVDGTGFLDSGLESTPDLDLAAFVSDSGALTGDEVSPPADLTLPAWDPGAALGAIAAEDVDEAPAPPEPTDMDSAVELAEVALEEAARPDHVAEAAHDDVAAGPSADPPRQPEVEVNGIDWASDALVDAFAKIASPPLASLFEAAPASEPELPPSLFTQEKEDARSGLLHMPPAAPATPAAETASGANLPNVEGLKTFLRRIETRRQQLTKESVA